MNKIIPLLIIPIVALSIVSGLLFNQLNVIQNENKELNDDLFEVNNKLKGEQNHSRVLENQVTELQNQTEQLEQRLVELENQRNELEEQMSKATNNVKITELSVHSTAFYMIPGKKLSMVNVTLVNFGINDVENLVLTLSGNSSVNWYTHNVTIIRTTEELVINPQRLRISPEPLSKLIVATLELNNQTIDQYTISIAEALT